MRFATVSSSRPGGGPVDTAASLRAHAALGLATMGHPTAANEIAGLLVDLDWVARAGAARALGALPPTTSESLLRFKALVGDEEPRVIGECFAALLRCAPAPSIDFVASFLDKADVVAEQAAIALGESRAPAALARLIAWRQTLGGTHADRVALLAIAMVRNEESFGYLLSVLRDEGRPPALRAVEALAIFRHDPRMCDAVLAAARSRRDKAVLEKVRHVFSP